LALVFDDLHWSDPASIALLLHLLPLTEQVPLLILAVMRPENQAPGLQVKQAAESEYGYRYNEISLQPLSAADSNELVDNLLAISNLPDPLRARILQKSEGNPFFVEEVVRTLIESEAVERDETGWHWEATAADETIEIPGNVQTLLTARIDRLGVETRGTLQLASVIGRYFYRRVLARIANQGADLDDQLLILQGTQLIQETSRLPELEYIFRHALTQEAAYSTILLRQRRRFHAQVGEVLESLFPDQHEALAGSLARHFFLAQDYQRALHYHTLAGDAAFRQFATVEAIEHYSKSIECSGKVDQVTTDQLVHLYTRQGRAYELGNQFDEALDNYQRMVELAQHRDDKALLLSSLTSQCIVRATHTPLYDPPAAKTLGEEALRLARELGDRAAEARVLWALLVVIDKGGGDKQRALAYGQKSLTISRELGLTAQLGHTYHDLASLYMSFDRYEEARQAALNARAVWLELNNTPMLADSYVVTATVSQFIGDYEAAIADAQEMQRISKSIGNIWSQIIAHFYEASAYLQQGDFGRTFKNLQRGLDLAQNGGIIAFKDIANGNLISLYLQSGAPELAEPLAEEIYQNRDRLVFGFYSMIMSYVARLKLSKGDLPQAEQIISEAYPPDLDAADLLFYVAASIHVVEALLYMAQTRPEQALESLDKLVERARRIGARGHLAEPLLIQGKALTAMDKPDQACEVLHEARAVAGKIGQRTVLWQILAALAEIEEQQGNKGKAKTYRDEARNIVDYIAAHSGSELRSSFLSLPEVKIFLAIG
jgi:tetratricopeptide (TPR) repeat protein